MDQLRDRTGFVTGAASGIGLAIARSLARAGTNVVLADVDEAELAVAVKSLSEMGPRVEARVVDVADRAAVEAAADWAWSTFGAVHVLCNNAGVDCYRGGPIWQATDADWTWAMGVNFWGVVNGVRTFLPRMLASGEPGHIVNTASAAALNAANNMYSTTKHAVLAFTEAVHSELAAMDAAVRITALVPGLVATPFFARRHRTDTGPAAELDLRNGAAIRAANDDLLKREGADPNVVGERAVRAILNNDLYALTHESSKEHVRRRSALLLDTDTTVPASA